MAQFIPCINFADRGREQLEFYKSVFGGEVEMQLVKDSGMAAQMPAEWGERIMHASLVSDAFRLMGSDIISDQPGLDRGNGYAIAIACDDTDQLNGYFTKLSDGGEVVFAPAKSEWGSTFGQCTDRFGVQWMLDDSALSN